MIECVVSGTIRYLRDGLDDQVSQPYPLGAASGQYSPPSL
jgi:hypothetical protein